MIFENEKIYKMLKKIWQYVFPAIGFLWSGLYKIWNIPYGLPILSTIFVLWGAMAIFLGISKWKYMNAIEGVLGDGVGEMPIEETESDANGEFIS